MFPLFFPLNQKFLHFALGKRDCEGKIILGTENIDNFVIDPAYLGIILIKTKTVLFRPFCQF